MIQQPFDFALPETTWTPPTELPDLRSAKRLSIDIESHDPDLQDYGPGFVRKTAKIVGVAVATDDWADYFPVGHQGPGNLARNVVMRWLNDQVKAVKKVVATNASYDAEGLICNGVDGLWDCEIQDTMNAEAIIDEELEDGYSLEAICQRRFGQGKDESLMVEAARAFGLLKKCKTDVKRMRETKKNLHLLPAQFVGPYAIQDAKLNLMAIDDQMRDLEREDLMDTWRLETDMLPIFLRMRMRGVPVDVARAEQLNAEMIKLEEQLLAELKRETGLAPAPWSPTFLKAAYAQAKIPLPKTAAGNDSVVKSWLEHQTDPMSKLILEYRRVNKMRRDFVVKDILTMSINGLIHPQYHQLNSDDGGTRSGRISMSNPNLQQIPARDPIYGPMMRSMYAVLSGGRWVCGDYSQQEPRLLLHYASLMNLPGAAQAVEIFRKNPRTDYHQMTTDIVNHVAKKNYKRKKIKGVNLGIMYAMGRAKLAAQIESTLEEADEVMVEYDKALPFVRILSRKCMSHVQKTGKIRTLLKRLRHFNYWEAEDCGHAYRFEKAQRAYPGRPLQRAWTHKALNALIQGSAADMTKEALRLLARTGYYAYVQVHDELDFGLETDKQISEVAEIMEHAVDLRVPVVVDVEVGDPAASEANTSNWGHLTEWRMAA